MAELAIVCFFLFSLVARGLTLTMNDLLGLGNFRQVEPEEPRVVEIIRWRQNVCITPAPGVLPCMISPGNSQASVRVNADYSNGYPHQYRRELSGEKKASEDGLLEKLTEDDSAADSGSVESVDGDDSPAERSAREIPRPKLYSPEVVTSAQLENMAESSLRDPSDEDGRRGRYLKLGSSMARTAPRRETVYVTKVVDSPVVATLVATTCLPDVGIPLCDEIRNPHQIPGQYQDHPTVPNPGLIIGGSPTAGNWNTNSPIDSSTTVESPPPPQNSDGQQQNVVQNIVDFVNRPDIVQTNESPEIKPVVVVQPTSPPGFFDGINAFLMPNGSWFGVFGGNSTGAGAPFPGIPGLGQLPQLPQFPQLPPLPQFPQLPPLPQLPQVPSLQQLLYRPENDISNPPNILSVFNLTNNRPGAGPPTQSPGIFGGMFASPSRPDGFNNASTTPTTAPSLLDGIGNIFRPTSRPLVIESPNQRPIVIERPVYVAEQPVIPGIFDAFQNPNRTVQLNSSLEPQVIKEPVYVLQRPSQNQPLFGILPNIFGTSSTAPSPTTSTAAAAPVIPVNQNPYHTQGNLVNSPDAIPGYVVVDSAHSVATASPSNPQQYGYSKSGSFSGSESYAGSLGPAESSGPSESSYSGIYLEESSTTPESDLEENDLLDGSLTEIVNVRGGVDGSGIADEEHVVEDVLDTTSVTEDEAREGYKNIDAVGIAKEINNEA